MDPATMSTSVAMGTTATEPLKSFIELTKQQQQHNSSPSVAIVQQLPAHSVPPQVMLAVVHNPHAAAMVPTAQDEGEDGAEGIVKEVYAQVLEAIDRGEIIIDSDAISLHRSGSTSSKMSQSSRPSSDATSPSTHPEMSASASDDDFKRIMDLVMENLKKEEEEGRIVADDEVDDDEVEEEDNDEEDEEGERGSEEKVQDTQQKEEKKQEQEQQKEEKEQEQEKQVVVRETEQLVVEPSASAAPAAQLDPLEPTFSCPICLDDVVVSEAVTLTCDHQACKSCLEGYYSMQVTEGKTALLCHEPKCKQELNVKELRAILSRDLFDKYVDFANRRALKLNPHARFCPAPDCNYAAIIKPPKKWLGLKQSKCQGPKADIVCGSPTCGKSFCYHCGQLSHPDLSCEENKLLLHNMDGLSEGLDNVKPCPRCATPIFKLQDGSCNHMKCSACDLDFCWLCMKEINDMHFFSPSGCTFYAKKPWSMKRKIASQVAFAVGAPVIIGLLAVTSVPAIMIAFPLTMGKKIKKKVKGTKKEIPAMAFGVTGSILVSPILAAGAIAVGVPVLLIGTYVAVPIYLVNEHSNSQKLKDAKKKLLRAIDVESTPPTEEVAP